jgi:hypothetical protein
MLRNDAGRVKASARWGWSQAICNDPFDMPRDRMDCIDPANKSQLHGLVLK